MSGNVLENEKWNGAIHDYQTSCPELILTCPDYFNGEGIGTIYIPIKYCPECGRKLGKNIEDTHKLLADKNNNWIPCSERLPEIRKDVLAVVKYSGFMGMHGTWIKIGHLESDNEWLGDCIGGKVIAWQPLPEPYREQEDE